MIKPINPDTLADILPLIRAYQTSKNGTQVVVNEDDAQIHAFFAKFGEDSPIGCQFAYYVDGTVDDGDSQAVAFATVVFSVDSVNLCKVAVLDALYVAKSHQCKGIARKLIEHCHAYSKTQGAVRLQWLAKQDDHTFETVYDRLDTQKSEWVSYRYE